LSGIAVVAKKVLRGAAEVGLDAAGLAVCGPMWPFFKKVLTPVVEELEKRYPKLFLVPEEADKAVAALEEDKGLLEALDSKFDQEFAALHEGQKEIVSFLVGLEETVVDISNTVKGIDQKIDAVDFKAIEIKIDEIYRIIQRPPVEPSLSIEEIDQEVRALQTDAMRWVKARVPSSARRRLVEARKLIALGIEQDRRNANLIALRGYLEKTESQVHELEGRHQAAISDIGNAADYFGAALKLDPYNIAALNGMANVALVARDYDTAIALGRIVTGKAPGFAAGAWDLALAIEQKMERDGQTQELVGELKGIYQHLVQLLPMRGSGFGPDDLHRVQSRLKQLEGIQ
jgi:tetratricopeptide (TPR) repeat protein